MVGTSDGCVTSQVRAKEEETFEKRVCNILFSVRYGIGPKKQMSMDIAMQLCIQ